METAKVFEDREHARDWRIEWVDDDDGCEVAIFSGPNARERALRYADRQYGDFEESASRHILGWHAQQRPFAAFHDIGPAELVSTTLRG